MELPHMGTHCSDSFCKQLDYLPMKCDACNELFCKDHLPYDDTVARVYTRRMFRSRCVLSATLLSQCHVEQFLIWLCLPT